MMNLEMTRVQEVHPALPVAAVTLVPKGAMGGTDGEAMMDGEREIVAVAIMEVQDLVD
jgi:hypothetical protein